MRRFTRLLTLLFMVCIVGVANAKTEKAHATFAAPTNTSAIWNAADSSFTWQQTSYNQIRNIGLPTGDITMYKKLVVDCEVREGSTFRILVYKGGSNLTLWAKDGVNEFILADTLKTLAPDDYNSYLKECSEICLSGSNAVATGEVKINDIYLETYDNEGVKTYATFAAPTNTSAIWNAADSSFTWQQTSYNQIRNIGLPTGDITMYKKLVVDCEVREGSTFRILVYKGGSNLTLWAKDGVNEFILADTLKTLAPDDYNSYLKECSEICLSGSNAVATGEVKINSIYLETYPENESVEIPDVQYEEDPGKPAGDFVDFTEAFPELQPRIGLGADEHPIELGNGDVVVGQRTKDVIADLSAYSKLTIVTSPNLKLVLYMNHEIDAKQNAGEYTEDEAGKYVFMDVQANENGIIEVDLTQFEKQDLNAICLPWDNSNKGTVWYLLLTKGEAAPVGQEVTFDFNASNHAVSNEGNEGDITAEEVNTVDGVVMTISPADEGVTPPNRYWKYNEVPQLRMYSGKITLTAPEGKAITKVVINNIKWNDGNTFNGEAAAVGTWEGNSTNVILAVAKNTQMNKIVVTLADKNEETTTYKEPAKPLFADGKYYINNVGTKKFLAAGADWGTHAVVNEIGLDYDLVFAEDGKYTIESQISNGGNSHFLNGEYNDGAAFGWTFAKVADGVYTISDGSKFLVAGEDGKVTLAADGTAEAAQWTLTSAEDVLKGKLATMEAATAENPVDVTFLIGGADFNRNDLRNAWKATKSGGNQTIAGPSENRTTYGCESWNNTFEVSQTIENILEGVYEFSIAGYGTNGTTKIFANETEAVFVNQTGAANFKAALDAIGNGEYTGNTTGKVNVIGSTLKIGVKRTEQVGQDWAVFDKAKLTYYGPVPADAYKEVYDAAMAAAKAAQADDAYASVTGEEKAALDKAITDNTTVEATAEAYKAAALALSTATTAFTDAKADYEALAAAKKAVEGLSFKYASDEKKTAAEATVGAEATSAADAKTKAAAIEKAYRQYAESSALLEGVDGSKDMTEAIVNPNAQEAIAEPWVVVKGEGSGGSLNILDGEPLTDGEGNSAYKYFDGGDWGAQAWDVALQQKIALPAGKYQLTASGRAAGDVNLQLFAGEATATIAAVGNAGGLFGRGWSDASVEFELAEADSVLIGVRGVTEKQYNWMSFTRFRLAIFEAPIEVQPDEAEKEVPEGWENLITNGNLAGDDVSCFFSKEAPAPDPYASTITPGAGKDNSRGIIIKSINSGGQDWDSQFFIRASKTIPAGTKLHMEFDYKASAAAKVSTQGHGEPGAYLNNDGVGDVNFTTEWQHLSQDFTTSGDIQTIAFNMNVLRDEASYYIDNIVFWAEKPAEIEWADIIVNGDMESSDAFNFVTKIYPATNPTAAEFTAGAGKDGSQGIKLESPAQVENPWDTQLWITLPIALEQGTKFKLEFDYKADAAVTSSAQYHAAPGDYTSNWVDVNFTTDWQHFEKQGIAPGANNNGNKFQSIAFNLSFGSATTLYFDNVKLFLDKETAATGIKSVNTETPFIEGAVYDLQGRRVATPAKGLYIVNGKKVMVK